MVTTGSHVPGIVFVCSERYTFLPVDIQHN